MIIDAHTHIFEAGRGGPFNLPASADDLVRKMDEHRVDVSVVIPMPDMASNKFVHHQCARFPDRLVGLYTPEFNSPSQTISKMKRFFDEYEPRGLKIHPRIQAVTISDTIVREVMAWADDHALPVFIDTFPYGPDLNNQNIHPLAYNNVAHKMPNLKIVLCHAGGCKVMEAFMVAKVNTNIILDISFTLFYFKGSSVAEDMGFVCGRLPAGQIIYGSDFPSVRFGEYLEAAHILTSNIGEPQSCALFGKTAKQLLSLR